MSDPEKTFVPNRLSDYSEQSILAEIRRVVLDECGGIVPDRDRFEKLARVSHWTVAKRFGSYRNGIQRAGFSLHRQRPRPIITKEQIDANLLEVLERANGHWFSQSFYRHNGGAYCEETVKARIGVTSWSDVMIAIGARIKPRVKHTVISMRAQRRRLLGDLSDTDLLNEIGRVWRENGRRPRYAEFQQASRFGIRVYETRYGSWTKAVGAFCDANQIEVQGLARARPTKDMLLAELRSVHRRHPEAILTYSSYEAQGGTYSRGVFTARLGGWTAAVNAVGGISGEQARHSKAELFDEIQRLWELLGRQPKQVEMSRQGSISPKCYVREFGSWTKAIHAFCDDRSTVEEVQSTITNANAQLDTAVSSVLVQNSGEARVATSHSVHITHKTGRTVSDRLRFKVFKRDCFMCALCGRSPARAAGLELEVDHVVAYSRGGETEVDNLQTLCKECNRGKADSTIDLPNNGMQADARTSRR